MGINSIESNSGPGRGRFSNALRQGAGPTPPSSRGLTFFVPPFSSSISRIKSAGLRMTLTCTLFWKSEMRE
jgi:hypothetical protein